MKTTFVLFAAAFVILLAINGAFAAGSGSDNRRAGPRVQPTVTYDVTPFNVEARTPSALTCIANQQAMGINNRGDVLGLATGCDGENHTYVYMDGFFNVLPGGTGFAQGINDNRLISGFASLDFPGGAMIVGYITDLNTHRTQVVQVPNARITEGGSINDRNKPQMFGDYEDAMGGFHGLVFQDSRGANRDFETVDYPGARLTSLRDGNDKGQFIGFYDDESGRHPLLYENGLFDQRFETTLRTLPGATGLLVPQAINDKGDIVGIYFDAALDIVRGFVFLKNGLPVPVDFPGAVQTVPTGINNDRVVVGNYLVHDDSALNGFKRYGFKGVPVQQ